MKFLYAISILILFVNSISFSQNRSGLFDKAIKEYNNNNFQSAISIFNSLIANSSESDPFLFHLHLWRGKSYYELDSRSSESLNDFILCTKLKKNNVTPYIYLSYIYSQQKDYTSACSNLEVAYNLGYRDDSLNFRKELVNLAGRPCFIDLLYKYNVKETILSYLDIIKVEVERRIIEWQKKGKFEKTADYQRRVSEETRNLQIQKFTKTILDSIAMSTLDMNVNSNDYDADNESFRIFIGNRQPIHVKVPVEEAVSFDRNFYRLKFLNPNFTLSENKFHILSMEIQNPENNKTYLYNAKDVVAFSSTELNLHFDDIDLAINNQNVDANRELNEQVKIINIGKSDVDIDIPENIKKFPNRFALIIGNEDYTKFQPDLNSEINVKHAKNDAKIFAEYAKKTLGIPEENIRVLYDAIGSVMRRELERIIKLAKLTNGEIVFYYAGHGFPDEANKEPYIMPVDISGTNVKEGINLRTLYQLLSEPEIENSYVFLDACFSGGGRSQGLLASRGVKIKPKEIDAFGNLVILAATKEDQVSLPFDEKQHGMFTYFLLKYFKENSQNLKIQQIGDYVIEQVQLNSIKVNYKEQTPTFMAAPSQMEKIKELSFN